MSPPRDVSGRAPTRSDPGIAEFVTLMALLMSMVALSTDAILPALPAMAATLGLTGENRAQLVVGTLFFGLAIGQMIYGPLSDAIGRKPAIYIGIAIFMVGCLFSAFATTFAAMLLGRALQGLGAAGPRIVTVALVRDRFEGRAMARVISLVMMVFILVPAIAPMIGQGILFAASWRAIYIVFLTLAVVAFVWLRLRQPETLPSERRRALSWGSIWRELLEICGNRVAFGYTLAAGMIFGAFVGYLTSAQQIFQVLYDLKELFPLFFGVLALAIGAAAVVNARLVMRHGMRRLSSWALRGVCLLSLGFVVVAILYDGVPPLWGLMAYLLVVFFCIGMLFANFNALAMEPLGHIAGMGAAVVGSVTTFVSLAAGTLIGQAYNETVLPLVSGFTLLGFMALATMTWIEQTRRR
ncbi:MAG TPA: multidrug effflux MFS transporter [Kiloniellaceae bacterium]|nr:multidrug effflux MFS transporter [Kiloniellaceae bacterium]